VTARALALALCACALALVTLVWLTAGPPDHVAAGGQHGRGGDLRARTEAVTGTVLLNGGAEVTGGPIGRDLRIFAEYSAESANGDVLGLRSIGSFLRCLETQELEPFEWITYTRAQTFTVQPPVPNWIGYYVTAQFRDVAGETSAAVCDDIGVEGHLWTATPTATKVAPTQTAEPSQPTTTVTPVPLVWAYVPWGSP
jgi:hypothetical protein